MAHGDVPATALLEGPTAQPNARSYVRATWRSRASSNILPVSITPTGSPSASAAGMLSDGCPVTLNGVVLPSMLQPSSTRSLIDSDGEYGCARLVAVGIRRKSTS